MSAQFPHLDHLIKAYFHQDYDLIAADIEGLMKDYVHTHPPAQRDGLVRDIERYLAAHDQDLAIAFDRDYGFDIDPQAWALSTKEFLMKLGALCFIQ